MVFMQHAVGTTSLLFISSFYFLLQLDGLTKSKFIGNCGKSEKQVGDHGSPTPLPERIQTDLSAPMSD